MREPFENIAIGNFLYGLGLGLGVRAGTSAPGACVNLLQQTPLDRPLGDVLLEFPGTTRLLEFKRRSADMTKEHNKHFVLNAALRRRSDLRRISEQIHWYIEIVPSADAFVARPYLKLRDRGSTGLDFTGLLDGLIASALSSACGQPTELLLEYLEAVGTFAGGHTGTSSGMLLHVGSSGGVRYVMVDDIRDLRRTQAELLEMAQRPAHLAQEGLAMGRNHEGNRWRAPEIPNVVKSRGRGHSL